jgi:polyisoprenoid-binding protein YceI
MDLQDWTGTWRLDPDRTNITFHSPTLWGLAHVKGTFTAIDGSAQAAAPDAVSGRLTLDAASVSTGIGRRDNHLRSADFFEVQTYPGIEVTVDSAEITGTAWVQLRTRLSVKGVEHQLELPTHLQTLGAGAVQLTTTTTLNRRTFGVDGNLLGMMGDAVTIEAAAVFVKQS